MRDAACWCYCCGADQAASEVLTAHVPPLPLCRPLCPRPSLCTTPLPSPTTLRLPRLLATPPTPRRPAAPLHLLAMPRLRPPPATALRPLLLVRLRTLRHPSKWLMLKHGIKWHPHRRSCCKGMILVVPRRCSGPVRVLALNGCKL